MRAFWGKKEKRKRDKNILRRRKGGILLLYVSGEKVEEGYKYYLSFRINHNNFTHFIENRWANSATK
jgi:hypothetical protein